MAKGRSTKLRKEESIELDHEQESPDIEDESQEQEEDASHEGDDLGVDKGNKASLVRAALARGFTKPRDGCRWIKETYGVEIEGTYFSVAKSQQAKKSGVVPTPRASSHGVYDRPGAATPTPSGIPSGFGSDVKSIRALLADHANEADAVKDLIATVDTLVRKYGVSGLNEMIDAFSE